MGKQAMGNIAYNQLTRMDTLIYLLVYPQRPLLTTRTIELVGYDKLGAGQNATVAVMSYSGYDIEDAMVMNKSSLDRGFGRCIVMKKISASYQKHVNVCDQFSSPHKSHHDSGNTQILDNDGLASPSEIIRFQDIYMQKECPVDPKAKLLPSQYQYRTSKQTYKGAEGETAVVDRVALCSDKNNNLSVKLMIRHTRRPEVSDKFSSRHGQKGVCGIIVQQEDFPFSERGICPDLIMNPHGFPSRMTVGKMIELLGSKAGVSCGKFHYDSAFGEPSGHAHKVEDISETLVKHGFCCNGITGTPQQAYIFMGPIYYQKLKHMVLDKMHAPPPQLITRQPTERRSPNGGLRVGEMERDCLIAYGTSNLIYERLMLPSNPFEVQFQINNRFILQFNSINMDTSPCIKEVVRSASVAFAPDAPFFAAGTMAGAVDMSFSSSANLEIFKLDFQSDDHNLPLIGAVPCSEPFNRLSWGKSPSSVSEEFSLGLIAGGLVDGNIGLWNPRLLIRAEENEVSFVQNLSRHRGPVRGLEFSSLSSNHLASGAEEGDICIWDLAKPTEPTHFPPLKGTGSATQGEISFLSWNKKVQPILASTSLNGTTVVWDLRKQKPIISFSDSVRRRCSVLQWHPDFATQLIVASDDDSSPSLRMWDMRNTMSPLRELVGHTKGVVAMSWCPNDSSYLLTCAKDNRTICWDTNSAEIVSELPAGTNWNFDVHWYPKIPGVISASSFDGKIGIYNIEACARYGVGESYLVPAPLKAPKWYQRKAGVTFGFGGKLVSFHSTGSSPARTEVNARDLVTELNLVSTSSEFEAAMKSGDRTSLRLLCDQKYQESESEDDKETWGFLKVMFEDDGTARTHLLNHLGFTLPAQVNETVEEADISHDIASLNLKETEVAKEGVLGDNGEDFFNNLPSPKADTPVSTSVNNFGIEGSVSGVDESVKESESLEGISDFSFDDAVQRALVVGDYKGAVAQCIVANKMADALVIAQVGGVSLWEKTRDQYLKNNSSPYLKVIAAMLNHDLVSLVNTRPLKSWKETLALLCTFAQREDWDLLCDTLASRLIAAGNTLAATLCYICAGNIDKTVEIWSKNVSTENVGKSYVDLQDLMEKTVVLALATGEKKFSASLCKLVEKYAEILASQGLLTTAMEYLKLMGTKDLSPELVILRDRIALSSQPEKEASMSMDSGNSQLPMAAAYGVNQHNSVTEPTRSYYQDAAAAYHRQNYQQTPTPSYGSQYQQHQQQQQPTTFVPSPAPHIPQVGFTPQPPSQSALRVFVPSTPPIMRNADQYQQPPGLGSQLYPSQVNANYQVGPPVPGPLGGGDGLVSSPMVPATHGQNVGPTPQMRGFMPMNTNTNTMGLQRSTSGQSQSPSPTPPVASTAPPPTVQTADVSNIPAHQRPVISTLMRLFTETSEAMGGSHAVPAKKREIDDNSKKLGTLFVKLNSGDISKNASEKLVQLCQALDRGDFPTALKIQVDLTTSDWDECSFWLATLKRMIKIRQTAR